MHLMSNQARNIDLVTAASRLSKSSASAQERRRFRRMPLVLAGRMLDPSGREHECRTADISPGDARILAPALPAIGERVVLYLDGFGRVSGNVARRSDDDAAIVFDISAHKREKLAEQLTLAVNKDLGIEETSKPHIDARSSLASIELESGETIRGEILDFSLTGVTVRTAKPPPLIGEWVRIGAVYGRVARWVEGGFAVDFEPRARPPQQQ